MSVYPVLEVRSLSERCARDIAQFMREQRIEVNPNPQEILSVFSTKEEIQEKISLLKPNFNMESDPTYVDKISHVEDPIKQQPLWIARTYLVYQLLIVLTLSLQNKELYNKIFLSEPVGDTPMFQQSFRNEVIQFLSSINLGIFGSLTPTSDIDIGFQYSGPSSGYEPCLAYIVSRFEMLFLIFTGKRCLDFDVESYADMITVPNPDSETKGALPDLFYLDTGKLKWDDPNTKRSLLPIAFNSIVRNVMMIDSAATVSFELNDVISPFESSLSIDLTSLKNDIDAKSEFEASKKTISTFLGQSYHDQIQAYYDAVNTAEALKVSTLQDKTTIAELLQLSDDQIIKLIVAIGQALTLRMESYTCSPTVVHVVRILQVEAQTGKERKEPSITSSSAAPSTTVLALQPEATLALPEKYVTTAPGSVCELDKKLATPRCVVGKTGFILSALEQLGYMYRFHKTYCEGGTHPDPKKCDKKMGKYHGRLNHAITNLQTAQGGGKRVNRRSYMKHSSMKSSSRYNHKTNTKKRHFKTVKKHHTKLYKKHRNSKKMKRAYMKKIVSNK